MIKQQVTWDLHHINVSRCELHALMAGWGHWESQEASRAVHGRCCQEYVGVF